jgi:hypothetical protein
MHDSVLFRVADVTFTLLLVLAASLGVAVAVALGELTKLTIALLFVAMVAPGFYIVRRG